MLSRFVMFVQLLLMTLTAESLGLLVHTEPVDNAKNPVIEVLVTLTTESLELLVRKNPVDDANNPVLKFLHVGRYSVRNFYRFTFNPFSIK